MPDENPPNAMLAGSLRRNCVSFVENLAQTAGSMAPSVLPYVFAGTVAAGTALSWALGLQARPREADQPA
jgi:hypothetical protein